MARTELLSPRAVAMATWRALAVVVVRWRAGSVDDKTTTAGALDRARLLMAFFSARRNRRPSKKGVSAPGQWRHGGSRRPAAEAVNCSPP